MKSIIATLFAILLSTLPAVPRASAAPTLIVQDQILMGATGVVVKGSSYDVEFKDGSCTTLFSNCDPKVFAFKNQDDAIAASQALLDTVFVNGFAGSFDSHLSYIAGCSFSMAVCSALTPFAVDGAILSNAVARNELFDPFDATGTTDYITPTTSTIRTKPGQFDPPRFDDSTYAVWTPARTAAVPEPGSVSLVAAAMIAAHALSRRKQA